MAKIRPIAIHLPQFYPFPENNEWWGNGFTEWTNVTKARPLFEGHYQPHLPADLGFYDLRLEEARLAQEALAKEYGIYGFCYYHYWFNGKRLLNEPVDRKLKNTKEDLPFMLCWANENWTRTWNGSENEILIAQKYSMTDAKAHFKELLKYFLDDRYIKIDGKPFFIIYKPRLFPDLKSYVETLRSEALKCGLELHLCAMRSNDIVSIDEYIPYFDAFIDFEPQSIYLNGFMDAQLHKRMKKNALMIKVNKLLSSKTEFNKKLNYLRLRLNYKEYVDYIKKIYEWNLNYILYPGISPSWDNTARRQQDAFILNDSTPEMYGEWLSFLVQNYSPRETDPFIFINAWNEWAEGNHLEPDQKWGKRYLEITRKVLLSK